ncbi:CAMK protein kinase [Saprolegnia parasitica CBS 223.65]|uniref:CAMK protein kinase n=1 Tax=Saprolegnia parasitica (strain CBS 223.65) TaxID=695850 RepID=A0A067CMW1_SAPPC|nr:CAMK protein kinase [Saprolegnia parasitica CBS 223.65]KDO30570.1 CAMK protein kinase [Saprolegnia parasitica CBS 223.65]|eukprot:XP_012198785.1 CAMK protein kinase [Saprolegnia parasitica CBS 223.65]
MLQLTWVRQLTHSARSEVHVCHAESLGADVVLKCMDAQRVYARGEDDVFAEPRVHKRLTKRGHPNILRLLGEGRSNNSVEMVLEYCAHGSLFDVLSAAPQQQFEPALARVYFDMIVSGLSFMHNEGYAHRDLSLENILVDENHTCKLADFGDAIGVDLVRTDRAGKLFYMAPEVYNGEYYIPGEADMWSLGIILFTMLTGHPVFFKAHESDPNYAILLDEGLEALVHKLNMAHLIPSMEMEILEQLLEIDPEERMTMDELLSHEYVAAVLPQPATLPALRSSPSSTKVVRTQRRYRYHPYDARANAAKHRRARKFEALLFNLL